MHLPPAQNHSPPTAERFHWPAGVYRMSGRLVYHLNPGILMRYMQYGEIS
jgi:hypothetical protein